MNSAVIVAAGTGARFGGDVPKQFLEVASRPVIAHAIARFDECPAVDEIVVVVSADQEETLRGIISAEGFKKISAVVHGGTTRAESVRNGLSAVSSKCDVVLVHDGARPLVSCEEIEETAKTARRAGAACLVGPVTDTIKEVSTGVIRTTVDRSKLRRAFTPQAFRLDILKQVIESTPLDASITDECMLVEKAGFDVAVVEGSPSNIKVTHPEDLILAEALLKRS